MSSKNIVFRLSPKLREEVDSVCHILHIDESDFFKAAAIYYLSGVRLGALQLTLSSEYQDALKSKHAQEIIAALEQETHQKTEIQQRQIKILQDKGVEAFVKAVEKKK